MTAVQPPLWPPGWEVEPCGDADAGERRQAITGDYGRSPSRGRRWSDWARGAETVVIVGGVL